jgi:hypothetical protein
MEDLALVADATFEEVARSVIEGTVTFDDC